MVCLITKSNYRLLLMIRYLSEHSFSFWLFHDTFVTNGKLLNRFANDLSEFVQKKVRGSMYNTNEY